MRGLEYFQGLTLLPHTWPIVRVDGRSFSRMTAARFEKPFDERFHTHMVATATSLLEELQGLSLTPRVTRSRSCWTVTPTSSTASWRRCSRCRRALPAPPSRLPRASQPTSTAVSGLAPATTSYGPTSTGGR